MEELTAMEMLMERSDGAAQRDAFSDTDFIIDEQSSHASGMEVMDRLMFLEQRVQMQDDEIQLLKINMADVLKRLNISEEQRRTPAKASRPASLCLTPKAAICSSSSSLRKSSSSTLPSSPSSRNYSPAPGQKRTPAGSSKDTQSTKVKTSSSSCRKALEIKPKETAAGKTGSRRVIHCKVTMQISLMPLSGRTGSAEPVSCPFSIGSAVDPCKSLVQKPSIRDAPKHKSPIKSPSSRRVIHCKVTMQISLMPLSGRTGSAEPVSCPFSIGSAVDPCKSLVQKPSIRDAPKHKSPIKSPSQYFQICY